MVFKPAQLHSIIIGVNVGLFQGNKTRRVGGTNTRSAVPDGFAGKKIIVSISGISSVSLEYRPKPFGPGQEAGHTMRLRTPPNNGQPFQA